MVPLLIVLILFYAIGALFIGLIVSRLWRHLASRLSSERLALPSSASGRKRHEPKGGNRPTLAASKVRCGVFQLPQQLEVLIPLLAPRMLRDVKAGPDWDVLAPKNRPNELGADVYGERYHVLGRYLCFALT